ncbi:MAG: hypothetical protein K1X44_02335 [Alphaproteobacteria bacterium]|nr:hypothetical protein [Alphaproteobacteria bacterium]
MKTATCEDLGLAFYQTRFISTKESIAEPITKEAAIKPINMIMYSYTYNKLKTQQKEFNIEEFEHFIEYIKQSCLSNMKTNLLQIGLPLK